MSKRDAILGKVRRAVDSTSDVETRRKAVAQRINVHARNLVPARAQIGSTAQIDLFQQQAEAVQATVKRVKSNTDIPEEITRYLRQHNLPSAIRHGADPMLNSLPWEEKAPALDVATGRADPSDEVSVSHAFAGVAETGTLALTSGADNPTTLNFLPENHIVVLAASDITGTYEDVWDKVRTAYGKGTMPRTVNMITGPSRTGDIEQRIELGAHGPRRVHIVIVEDA